MEMVERMLEGDELALSKLITMVENGKNIPDVMGQIHHRTGRSHVVGITGPPGAGKSTLVNRLIMEARNEHLRVGIIAVDPTSPFTNGALLGDRIRMLEHSSDMEVFLRSMATRGSLGGLSQRTKEVVKLLDAFGKEFVFVETVGVGQIEIDIMEVCDSIVVVLVPESGDTVQTMKAGLLEMADIFVVNKADRDGAELIAMNIRDMLSTGAVKSLWSPRVHLTESTRGKGVKKVYEAIKSHFEFLKEGNHLQELRNKRIKKEIDRIIRDYVEERINAEIAGNQKIDMVVERAISGRVNPYSIIDSINVSVEMK
jgi:LAO/AO transport system kinase